jgi:formate dehydrogenase subunit gamma
MKPATIRRAAAALGLAAAMALAAPALAQGVNATSEGPANQGGTTRNAVQGEPNASNPTASAVSEDQLFRQLDKLTGRITIPDAKAATLEQPQGREYRGFREGTLPWLGGIFVLGMLAALALFYFTRGRIRLEHSEESGRKIQRFNAFERFTHWMTAMSFIVLAISGLNYIFGKRLLMPLIGADAFATWSQWAKLAHNFIAWPFMLGVLLMLVLWIRDNIPDRYDAAWLRAGGGFFNNAHPPAARFNAGQKLIFWSVILGGVAISASGLMMLFPFQFANIAGMQIAQYVHGVAAIVLIAIILAHIYIGSLGMEGAYEAMGTGEVDLAWAKEHHSAWVEGEKVSSSSARPSATPAE